MIEGVHCFPFGSAAAGTTLQLALVSIGTGGVVHLHWFVVRRALVVDDGRCGLICWLWTELKQS